MTHFQRVMSKMCVFIHVDVTRMNQCDGVLFFLFTLQWFNDVQACLLLQHWQCWHI